MRLDDGQLKARVFHLAIGPAELSQQIRPAHLEPDEVVGVVHHAHLVGLRITHAHGRGAGAMHV